MAPALLLHGGPVDPTAGTSWPRRTYRRASTRAFASYRSIGAFALRDPAGLMRQLKTSYVGDPDRMAEKAEHRCIIGDRRQTRYVHYSRHINSRDLAKATLSHCQLIIGSKPSIHMDRADFAVAPAATNMSTMRATAASSNGATSSQKSTARSATR